MATYISFISETLFQATHAQATSVIVVAIALIISMAALQGLHRKRRLTREGHHLPPGPPVRWPWDDVMPTTNISATFDDWANKYGPVITLHRGSEISIVIARVDAAIEIMEKEGSALANRPVMIAASDFLSGGKRFSLISGTNFRRSRKAIHTVLQTKALEAYKNVQSDYAKIFIRDLLDDPKNHIEYAHRYSTSVILRVTYGKSSPTSLDDPELVGIKQVVKHFIEGLRPGAYLVDRGFPWLKYVPGYGRRLKEYHQSDLKFYSGQLNRVKSAMLSDDAGPSFSRTLLENVDDHQLSFDDMSYLAGILFEAGSDTTKDGIVVMIMAAACFPDTQLRVQQELDLVVGSDRLPNWNDWDDLPQLRAFISESLRWRPVTPLGFSHCSTRDIIWRGYWIPAGTTVMGNQWAISRDPIAFPDPEKFDPQRWIDKNGKLRDDVECFPFGFGRRVCPGMHFANRSLFISLAFLLWSFRIVERPGAPIDTTPDKDNVIAHLQNFEVDYVPRIEGAQLRMAMM